MTKNYQNLNVLVLGWARSGKAAARFLNQAQANVMIYNDEPISDPIEGLTYIKELSEINWDQLALLVKNPGIKYEHPAIVSAEAHQVPVVTEVQVALDNFSGSFIGVTGSNGKTTTTSLIDAFLTAGNIHHRLAGNIGTPVTEVVDGLTKDDWLVLELSSFQLLGAPSIHPKVAVVTNLFASHLDYHHTREAYIAAKFNLTIHQTTEDILVYNADQDDSQAFADRSQAHQIGFSTQRATEGTYVTDQMLYRHGRAIMPVAEMSLVGEHNYANIAAAVTAVEQFDFNDELIIQVLKTFSGLPHRLQKISSQNEIDIYNDSKATDIEATQRALGSFNRPIILLAGGLDRGDSFDRLVPDMKNVKTLLTFGETSDKLHNIGQQLPQVTINEQFETMELATQRALALAEPGDVVLLSPAAASWDQYKNFEIRGQSFIDTVNLILNKKER